MRKLIILFFILGIVSIVAILFYINRPLNLPQNNPNPTTTGLIICNEFSEVAGELSCANAVQIAEEKYGGIAQSIAIGSNFRKKSDPNPQGKDIWRIDLLLNKPLSKDQQIVTQATVFLDRKTGEELKISYF